MSDISTTYARTIINVVVRLAPNDGWFEAHTRSRQCITQYDVGCGFLARRYLLETVITFRHDFRWPAITTTLGKAAQNRGTYQNHNVVKLEFGRAR
jgi:hypothetical protein